MLAESIYINVKEVLFTISPDMTPSLLTTTTLATSPDSGGGEPKSGAVVIFSHIGDAKVVQSWGRVSQAEQEELGISASGGWGARDFSVTACIGTPHCVDEDDTGVDADSPDTAPWQRSAPPLRGGLAVTVLGRVHGGEWWERGRWEHKQRQTAGE